MNNFAKRPGRLRAFRAVLLLLITLLGLPFVTEAAGKYDGTWQSGSGGATIKAALISSGKYRLTVASTGKTLTVSTIKQGAAIKKAAWKKTKTQLWTVKKQSDGTISFLSAKNAKYALNSTKSSFTLKKAGTAKAMRFSKVTTSGYPSTAGTITSAANGVKQNGWLSVSGTKLINEKGKAVTLHGMSSHGLQWYGQFTTSKAIGATAAYGANLFRVAMYTEENGYLANKTGILKSLYAAVDHAISRNMYVIVDWHILSDGNPNTHKSEAKAFFKKVSARYANTPNVLYEICNEPNGGTSWQDIKAYAKTIIPVIRKNSPKSIVIVGTPTWSQDVDAAAADPLSYKNVMYAFHFYAGTHGQYLRDKVTTALKKGAPIFVTEWGTSAADGNGGVYTSEAATWLTFLKTNGLSWANWSLCDKNESSAALKPGANAENGIATSELSASGRFVFKRF